MGKDKERSLAKILYVDQGKTAKEISQVIHPPVSEQTLSKWINDPKDNWKDQRNAKISNSEVSSENIGRLIDGMCEDRLQLAAKLKVLEKEQPGIKDAIAQMAVSAEIQQIRKNLASIDDSVSKWSKTRDGLKKTKEIPLESYMKIMEEIFNGIRLWNEKIYLQTIDFQEQHLNTVAGRYK